MLKKITMTEQAVLEWVVILACVIGTFARTLLPYWNKLQENPETVFEKKFLGTAALSFITSLAIGFGIFPSIFANVESNGSLTSVFAIAALMAFGINTGANMIAGGGSNKPEEPNGSLTPATITT